MLRCALSMLALSLFSIPLPAQTDTDHDGLPDALEAALLTQFTPTFFVSQTDCSVRPALFAPNTANPQPLEDNGTIYGQAFHPAGHPTLIELHFFHLWRRDCGERGHNLDTEHVAALLEPTSSPGQWQAVDWYAAAHEDTVCDASQFTRASTIGASNHGPRVWISAGKHASFLDGQLCQRGCGGDHCDRMSPLASPGVINLGELEAPMNGSSWVNSSAWPLAAKLARSDFPAARLSRLDQLPATDIAWANPQKRPEQAVIAHAKKTYTTTSAGAAAGISGADAGLNGAATGIRATDTALVVTGSSLSRARDRTGNALGRSAASVRRALKRSADAVLPAPDLAPANPSGLSP